MDLLGLPNLIPSAIGRKQDSSEEDQIRNMKAMSVAQTAMATNPGIRLVNKQFNSPINLYSAENVADVLSKQSQILANGAVGIDFHQLATPGNLANSAVLRMLEEEERQRGGEAKGLKRVTWPPPPEFGASEEQAVYSKGPAFGDSIVQQTQTWSPQSTPQQQPDYQSPPPSQPVYEPPTTVILRSEAPVSQEPPPIYTSQPAAIKVERPRMRGDEKWPPVEYKTRAAAENDARVALARGPTFRPRKVKRDYTSFFAQNALTPNYPSYRAPPGTQHYVEEGTSNF